LRKFGLHDGKSASTPIDTEKPLLKDPDGEDVDVHTYKSMTGSLMYLPSSRPDIMFAVYGCARFQVAPKASHLHADKYVAEILRKFGLHDGKSASTPIDTEKPLLKDPDGEDVDVHTYKSMTGSLMYLPSSRPDIMFAVYGCARFQVAPKASHLHAVKRILKISRASHTWACGILKIHPSI
nr:hypothetical protein [Tanacetum cinerariifolium]